MDVGRFPPRQDAESGNPLERLSSELLPPRRKAAFFGYFLCGGKASDPAAQRSEVFETEDHSSANNSIAITIASSRPCFAG
jgi:hypothetical protein